MRYQVAVATVTDHDVATGRRDGPSRPRINLYTDDRELLAERTAMQGIMQQAGLSRVIMRAVAVRPMTLFASENNDMSPA